MELGFSDFLLYYLSYHYWLEGFSIFARRYLRYLYWFLFLRLLRCFNSPGFSLLGISPLGNFGFIVPLPNFSWFFTSLFYYTSSHPSNTYIYFTLFFLRSRGIEPLSWSWKDLILPLYYKRSSVLLSIGGNRTLFYDFADHITNPYNADVWVIVPALRTNYSGGNRTPATMLTASRSTIKLPNIGKWGIWTLGSFLNARFQDEYLRPLSQLSYYLLDQDFIVRLIINPTAGFIKLTGIFYFSFLELFENLNLIY